MECAAVDRDDVDSCIDRMDGIYLIVLHKGTAGALFFLHCSEGVRDCFCSAELPELVIDVAGLCIINSFFLYPITKIRRSLALPILGILTYHFDRVFSLAFHHCTYPDPYQILLYVPLHTASHPPASLVLCKAPTCGI